MKKSGVALVSVLATLICVAVLSSSMWPLINDVRTGGTPEYPDIQPQRFAADTGKTFDAALAAMQALGLEILSSNRDTGEIRGVATTRLMRFKDDVTVTISRDGMETVVNIRSVSRVGKGDFGANARRIRALQAAIAGRL